MAEEARPNEDMERISDEEDRDEQTVESPRVARYGGGAAVAGPPAGPPGFFHIYKPGQGYWTRMFTGLGAALFLATIALFIYTQLQIRFGPADGSPSPWIAGTIGVLTIGAGLWLWGFLNKPRTADFLIATESEMRKVNWTSRKDLIGSTWVVIVFMFLIAAVLFVIDVVFGWLFQLINVLKHGPFAG